MQTLIEYLTQRFTNAFLSAGAEAKYGQIVPSQRLDLGQFQCNGALPAAKSIKQNPRILAQQIVDAIEDPTVFSKITIDGPGFLNITLCDSFLSQWTQQISQDKRLGCPVIKVPRKVIIDFGGPNVAKPLHVGHLRPHIIGDCIQRLMRFRGDHVTSDVHLGDWGTQMGMLICMVRATHPELPYFDPHFVGSYPQVSPVTVEDLEIMYPTASTLCKQDPEAMIRAQRATVELQQGNPGYIALWKHFVSISIEALKKIYTLLDVSFDLWLGESDAQPLIPSLVQRLKDEGHAQLSEGAWIIPVGKSATGEEMPPLLLVKSDGGFLYPTTDLATIQQRIVDLNAELIVYVVDKRQSLHFRQVFKAAQSSGIATHTSLVHTGFGTMNGTNGKPFKTRDGGTLKLLDLIDMVLEKSSAKIRESGIASDLPPSEQETIIRQVGISALKYADLMNYRESDYQFDIDKFVSFEGNTGPYLLYASVRIKSILRKAEELQLTPGAIITPVGEADRQLMVLLTQLPDAINTAYDCFAPHHLCDFLYRLSTSFNQFYRDCHILGEKNRNIQESWLSLVKLCLNEMELVSNILGLQIPNRM